MIKLFNQFKQGGVWFHLFSVCAWSVILGAVFYTPPPPVEFIGGDSVNPAYVKAGGEFQVIRNFHVNRMGSVQISRVMITGDCTVKCDILDLPSSTRYFGPIGKFRDNSRPLRVPQSALPGVYRLQFTLLWEDRWGRSHEIAIPELTLEVIP